MGRLSHIIFSLLKFYKIFFYGTIEIYIKVISMKEATLIGERESVNPNFGSTKDAIKHSVINFLADEIAEYCEENHQDVIELYDNDDNTLYFTMIQKPYEDELNEFIEANYDIGSWITKRYGESKIQILIIERGINEYQYDSEITLLWL